MQLGRGRLSTSFATLTLIILLGGLSSAHAQVKGTFRAVVAISTRYVNQLTPQPRLADSVKPLEDALRAFAIRSGYGEDHIDIRFLLDVDSDAKRFADSTASEVINEVFDAAYSSTLPSDTLVFFFSGHGGSDGPNTILYASGADGRRPSNRIVLNSDILSDAWRKSPAGVKLIFIDACQTPVAGGLDPIQTPLASGALSALQNVNYPATKAQGTALFFAADEGGAAWVDDEVGYGFFTRFLVMALKTGGAPTAQALAGFLTDDVGRAVRQRYGRLGRSQRPEFRVLASSGGDYRLSMLDILGLSSSRVPMPPTNVQVEIVPEPISVALRETRLRKSDHLIYDARTGLAWARNLAQLGTTPALFTKSTHDLAELEADFAAIEKSVSKLSFAGRSDWRLATRSELEALAELGGGSLFFAFSRTQKSCQNLAGIFDAGTRRPAIWGYQHQNVLLGPTEWGWGSPTTNQFGVWLVSSAPLPTPSQSDPVYEVDETSGQQSLSPIVSSLLVKSSDNTVAQSINGQSVHVGNLDGEVRAVFEYSLKRLPNGEIVRLEIVLEGQSTGGDDPVVEISPYTDASSTNGGKFTTKWFAPGRTQIEIPAEFARGMAHASDLIKLHFRYAGVKGDVQFALPKLMVTYVPEENLLVRRPEYASLDELCPAT